MFGAKPSAWPHVLPEEDTPGRPACRHPQQRSLGAPIQSDPAIVGQTITLNGKPYTVVGVLDGSFMLNAEVMPSEGPMDKVDIFLPWPWDRMPRSAEATKTTTSLSASSPASPCNRPRRTST